MLLVAEGLETSKRDDCEQLWRSFYSDRQLPEDFTVLDPFLGGGTSLVEAAKLGAHCIGVDIDPVACFVAAMELTRSNPLAIQEEFDRIATVVEKKITALYQSSIDGVACDVVYYFWVDRISCPECLTHSDGHPTYQMAYDTAASKQTLVCPHCGAISTRSIDANSFRCASCDTFVDLLRPPVVAGRFCCPQCSASQTLHHLWRGGAVVPRMFALEHLRPDGTRGFAPVTDADLALYRRASRALAQTEHRLPIPDALIPVQGRADRRPLLYGYRRYREMFNDRQLYCLGLIAEQIKQIENVPVRQGLALAFSQSLATNNMFCGYAFGYRRLTPLFGVHSYRKISRPVEGNVWGLPLGRGSFQNCVRAVIAGSEYMQAPFEYRYRGSKKPQRVPVASPRTHTLRPRAARVLNQNSESLAEIPSKSVDLILTDPPYFDNLSYSELSDFYHVWLREILGRHYCGNAQVHTPISGALFAGPRKLPGNRADARKTYLKSLTKILRECHRVAKDDARLIFTFHHRSDIAWVCLGTALLSAKFSVCTVFPVRSEGQSGFHSYEGSLKWDSVFVCQKAAETSAKAPSDRLLGNVAQKAASTAAKWRTRIRRSRLAFSDADERSLARSLVVQFFSTRQLTPSRLEDCMALIEDDA